MKKKSIADAACLAAPSSRRLWRTPGKAAGVLLLLLRATSSIAGEEQQNTQSPGGNSRGNVEADSSASLGEWRTIHTKAADGVTDTTAILHVADLLKSDPRLAGLMLRCNKQGVEPVIVVVEPFSPQARPKITLRADNQEFYFEGKPLPTGAGLRVPADGLDLVKGPWKGASELTIRISDADLEISGVVELSGLTNAIKSLADCAGK